MMDLWFGTETNRLWLSCVLANRKKLQHQFVDVRVRNLGLWWEEAQWMRTYVPLLRT
jgi:hypothetical protein